MKTKKCTKCGIEKELDCFHKDSRSKDALESRCKSCTKKKNAEYYQNNKEKFAKRSAEYRKNNKEKIAKKDAEYYQNNKEKILKQKAEYSSRPEVKEKILKRKAEYYQNNKERKAEYNAEYISRRKAKQPACVYKIVNKANGKTYIGQTMRGELRWKDHHAELRGNYHQNGKLQADFNKFGEEAFEWSIIKECPKDKDILLLEEARIIVKYRKEGKDLYNIYKTEEK